MYLPGNKTKALTAVYLLLVGAGGCLHDAPLGPREPPAASLSLAAEISGLPPGAETRLTVLASYRGPGGSLIALGQPHSIVVESGGSSKTDSVLVDLTGCLRDATREGAGEEGCRLAVTVALIDTDGTELTTQTQDLGSVSAGAHVTAPQAFVLTVPIGPPSGITISLAINTLQVGQATGATAVVQDGRGHELSDVAVEWVSSNDAIVSVTPDSAGALTATVTGVLVGVAKIRAQVGSLASEPVTVTVTPSPPASVTVNLETSTLVVNTSTTATAVVRDAQRRELQGIPVTWTSSDSRIATALPTAPGAATATVTGLALGEAGIIATVGSGADIVSGTRPITVEPEKHPSITVSIDLTTFAVNETVTATAVVLDPNGTPLPNEAVTWTSDAPNVAAVTPVAAGAQAATVRGVGQGTANISAALVSDPSVVSLRVPVLVTAPQPAFIDITLADASLVVDQQVAATAVVRDHLRNVIQGQSVTWTSGVPTVASVTSTGPLTATVVGVDAGNTQIQAALGTLLSNTVAVTVRRVPTQLSFIQGPPPSVEVGGTFSVAVAVQDAQGRPVGSYNAPITISLDGTGGGSLGGNLQQTPQNGVATFSGLSVSLPGTGYTLTANSGALPSATSGQFEVFIPSFTLTVRGGGTGSGVVVINPGTINCFITNGSEASESCSADYDLNTRVVLRAAPSGNDEFDGWSGAGCSGRELCTVTMDQAQNVVANFTRRFLLTVQGDPDGSGTGTVSSDDDQINCTIVSNEGSGTCQAIYRIGAAVDLTPSPAETSTFGGWTGCQLAIGSDHCFLSMDQTRTVTARFIFQIP